MVLEVFEELLGGHARVELFHVLQFLVLCLVEDGHDEVDTSSVSCILERSIGAFGFMCQFRSLDDRFPRVGVDCNVVDADHRRDHTRCLRVGYVVAKLW